MDKIVQDVNDIQFPSVREEIISSVNALANREYQQNVWAERKYPHPGYYDDFSMNIHVLYDDTNVLEDPEGAIGTYLTSHEEAEALANLYEALEALFTELGTELADIEYIKSDYWEAVVEAAVSASQTLSENNEK
ncbi:SCO4402 family protein [Streptosporangium saharense]|uniref:SCO4402 family protein n=1 Tax=Streptosporangium saharense TaxID=1706840 RepID=UPI00369B3F66